MKNKIIVLFLLISPFITHSQTISNYGFKIGLVSSKTNLTTTPDHFFGNWFSEKRVGVTFGVFANMLYSNYFDFESEILYHQEGSEDRIEISTLERPDGIGEYIIVDHEFDFLKLNLNIKPKYKINNFILYLKLGPSLNYLIKNRGQIYFENLSKFHLGYVYGFGITINKVLNQSILIEFNSNGYFDKFADTEKAKADMKSWQINIGISLN